MSESISTPAVAPERDAAGASGVTALMRRSRTRIALVAALAAPAALATCLVPFRSSFANTATALAFVIVIVACAVGGNRIAGVVASISSAIFFDLLLTEPYGRLAISHRADLETTVSLLAVGLIVTELAARSRHHLGVAAEQSGYVSMVHELAQLGSSVVSSPIVVRRAEDLLVELLGLRACRFDAGPPSRPLARIKPDGRIVHAGIGWPAHDIGIPGPQTEIPVSWRGVHQGRFLLTPTPGLSIDLERRIVAVALAELVAATLADEQVAA
jgi:hypothetical protein